MIFEINKDNEINNRIPFIDKDYLKNEFKNNPFAKVIVLKEDNTIIGYLYYSDIYDRLEINQIEIVESKRGLGNATTLLNYLTNNVEKDITLEVRKDNIPEINLYKKFNFKETAIRKSYYNGIDGILMERKKDSD